MSEKYVGLYVSEELANQLEKVKGRKEIEEEILLKYINEQKIDIKASIESLDDDIIKFKAVAITHKNELKKVYDEQYEKLENLYDNIYKKKDEIKYKVDSAKIELQSLDSFIRDIDTSLGRLNTYKIDELLKVVNKVSSMSAKEKRIMNFLICEGRGEI